MSTRKGSGIMAELVRYRNYAPTGFDTRGLNGEDAGISDWYVAPVIKTRDATVLEESNFAAALALLGGEGPAVEVHSLGHWACGHFEIILVSPYTSRVYDLETIVERLDNYPILDEEDLGERESDEIYETWKNCYGLRERVELCAERGESIFAARDVEIIPDAVYDYLRDRVLY
jgi:hypothetical protein